jgi:hypothetical protein
VVRLVGAHQVRQIVIEKIEERTLESTMEGESFLFEDALGDVAESVEILDMANESQLD